MKLPSTQRIAPALVAAVTFPQPRIDPESYVPTRRVHGAAHPSAQGPLVLYDGNEVVSHHTRRSRIVSIFSRVPEGVLGLYARVSRKSFRYDAEHCTRISAAPVALNPWPP